jgi:hypothetical protein
LACVLLEDYFVVVIFIGKKPEEVEARRALECIGKGPLTQQVPVIEPGGVLVRLNYKTIK